MTQSTTFGYTMPVRLKYHDSDINLRPGTTKSDIVAYLYQNPEWGYSPQDLKETLDIPRGTATTTLKRLYDDGYRENGRQLLLRSERTRRHPTVRV